MTYTSAFDPDLPLSLIRACPVYRPSPLVDMALAGRVLSVKDETRRMGLGAFKALGGVYAVARLAAEATGVKVTPDMAFIDALRARAGDLTFVCASAGNHGMAVAAGARLFGAKARVILADPVPEAFADRLRARGAEVARRGAIYEESVAAAIEDAESTGAIHLADGSWPGYTRPPLLVMEGYTVIASELAAEFEGGEWPTHVFLQAGVGGLAAAVADRIRASWPVQPRIVVVEPEAAPCLGASHRAGKVVEVEGPVSSMGRLDCKVPSMLAFDILTRTADEFVTVSDAVAEATAAKLASAGLASTPSGVAGVAAALAGDLPDDARPLVIVSEGAVDAG
ncbi:pyridoxal-phosphate dependent enzyme [Chachezhania sediminis]|uniref:pyridoxal-phosphate dependent enzyme n=1 Tax=Chachezhania sediminis TaxID=2599291 RepID=UPI00131A8975|nr:pyridoxal-phosphate dependent enzyme [Chachezhania sediminis]